eukprot:Mycagemm_TRINITY_DN11231_c0_g1::TRINITY_DN11231_c0_g1_i1::g.5464::m.5464 type:complete len:121 gc:universal TRINITY_DN11231_c0_g1_i1:447-85(-)
MPGIVNLYVWQQRASTSSGSLELIQERRVVIFGANPGAVWCGFGTFVKSLANEYPYSIIQHYHSQPEVGTLPTFTPDIEYPPIQRGLPSDFVFPSGGALPLVIISPLAPLVPMPRSVSLA